MAVIEKGRVVHTVVLRVCDFVHHERKVPRCFPKSLGRQPSLPTRMFLSQQSALLVNRVRHGEHSVSACTVINPLAGSSATRDLVVLFASCGLARSTPRCLVAAAYQEGVTAQGLHTLQHRISSGCIQSMRVADACCQWHQCTIQHSALVNRSN